MQRQEILPDGRELILLRNPYGTGFTTFVRLIAAAVYGKKTPGEEHAGCFPNSLITEYDEAGASLL